MQLIDTPLNDVKRLLPDVYGDERGWFAETFSQRTFTQLGLPGQFVQDNQSLSLKGVLRGLHYQLGRPQGKLVRAFTGHIWDVAVDLRRDSTDFGKWAGFHLSEDTVEYLWIPEGFAHGFVVLSESANVLYKTTNFYFPEGERCIRWDDPTLAIEWPLDLVGKISLSGKDQRGTSFLHADLPPVPEAVSRR
ncbi:dTDP-4-dehydrorhamnose 3,5-epimerase [Terriglobus tenax]|uniref:dTDP-4-dehydrorhamnose 3,5-epimerase n=1 Tax=Terriglobus tenax TaxID=1111115 RepID=UPI0021E0D8F8|nr:dTDP-4-dehydrorhamnose 3,5-epimerase [Terriglobus tenax]